MDDNLPELRDIHLPEGVSIWPPAYGWYVIIISIIALYFFCKLYFFLRLKSKKIYALKVLAELDQNNVTQSASEISELLRRICVYRYPEAVAFDGKKWLNFLQQHNKKQLPEQGAELLLNAPYANPQKNKYSSIHLQELIAFAQAWIGENL